jgi:hypothetical protein
MTWPWYCEVHTLFPLTAGAYDIGGYGIRLWLGNELRAMSRSPGLCLAPVAGSEAHGHGGKVGGGAWGRGLALPARVGYPPVW